MPTIEERIAAIDAMLARGATSVRDGGKGVELDLDSLRRERNRLEAERRPSQRTSRTLVSQVDE